MFGPVATLPDITLRDIAEVVAEVVPSDDDRGEDVGSSSLSPDSLGEEVEPELDPYRVKTTCYGCEKLLRFIVVSGPGSLKVFESLLCEDLTFLCPGCVAVHLKKNGRR